MTKQIKITVVSLEGLTGDLVTPKEFKFDLIRNREAIRDYIASNDVAFETLTTKLPTVLHVSDIGSPEINLAAVSWLKQVVLVEIPSLYITAYGYIQDGQIRINSVSIGAKHYHVVPGHASYSEIFKSDDPYIGYRLDPNAVFSAVDAYPYLANYNIIDPRFCMTSEHLITKHNNVSPRSYLIRLLTGLSAYRMDVSKPWHQNYTPEPIDVSHVNIIDVLISNGVPDWTRFGSEFKIKTIEADRISQAELRRCLIGLRSPLVTYDYDLWYHNIGELYQLGEFLSK